MSKNLGPQIFSGKKDLNLLYWNIYGQKSKLVGDKFSDAEFLNLCSECDILGIAELHTNLPASIKGFKRVKQKIRKKTGKGPKLSGGLAVFVKNELSHMVTPVTNSHDDSIWIKISKESSKEDVDIYIGTLYISPSKNKDTEDSLETLFNEALSFQKKGIVFIQGDFNARTGGLPDYLVNDKSDEIFNIKNHETICERNSEDNKTCPRGLELTCPYI